MPPPPDPPLPEIQRLFLLKFPKPRPAPPSVENSINKSIGQILLAAIDLGDGDGHDYLEGVRKALCEQIDSIQADKQPQDAERLS